jgi:hypothetical protein
MEFTANILHFTQYLISSVLDLLKRKCDWYITSNIQLIKLPTDISEKISSKSG